MATSPRMKWPYPSEGEDPWYSAFQDLVVAQDTTTTALLEAKNVILSGGGSVSWDATSGLLTWTQPIQFNSANTGFAESIPAGSISVPQDSLLGFVRYVSFPTAGVVLTLEVAASLPVDDIDRTLVLFRRKGTRLYYRTGAVQETGTTLTPFEGNAGVSTVTATTPLASTGGSAPVISLTGVVGTLHGGTGITGGFVGTFPYYDASGTMATTPTLPVDWILLGDGPNGMKPLPPGAPGQVLALLGTTPTWTTLILGVDATATVKGNLKLLGGLSGLGSSADFPVLNLSNPNVSGTLDVAYGGTGSTVVPPAGSVVVGDGTKQAYTAVGTVGQPLLSNAGLAPAFGPLNLAGGGTVVTGLLPEANQAAQTLSGDVIGNTSASIVAQLRGFPVSTTTPVSGQLLGFTGSAWTPVTQGGGGNVGGGQVYYFNYGTSGPVPAPSGAKQMDFQYLEGSPQTIPVTATTGGVTIAGFVTPLNDPSVSYLPPGNWEANVYADSTAAANASGLRFKLYKYDGTTPTLLLTSPDAYISNPGVVTQYTISAYVPPTDVAVTDRLYVEIEAFTTSGTATVTGYFDGTATVSHVHTSLGNPGGTGLLKVANGYLQNPASLLTDADVDNNAAIAVSKLAATSAATITPVKVLGTNGTTVEWVTAPATGVLTVTAGTGLTNSGTATNPILNVSYGTTAGTALEGSQSVRLLPASPSAFALTYYSTGGGGAWLVLANGTTGQVLTATTGGAPSWQTPTPTASSTFAWRSTSGVTTFGPSDVVVETTGSASFTVTLPTAVGITGKMYILKHSGTGTIVLDGAGTELIDGSPSVSISTQYMSYTLISNGTGWIIV